MFWKPMAATIFENTVVQLHHKQFRIIVTNLKSARQFDWRQDCNPSHQFCNQSQKCQMTSIIILTVRVQSPVCDDRLGHISTQKAFVWYGMQCICTQPKEFNIVLKQKAWTYGLECDRTNFAETVNPLQRWTDLHSIDEPFTLTSTILLVHMKKRPCEHIHLHSVLPCISTPTYHLEFWSK